MRIQLEKNKISIALCLQSESEELGIDFVIVYYPQKQN